MLQTVIRFSVFSVNILQRKPFSNAGVFFFYKCNMTLFFTAILRDAASVKDLLFGSGLYLNASHLQMYPSCYLDGCCNLY